MSPGGAASRVRRALSALLVGGLACAGTLGGPLGATAVAQGDARIAAELSCPERMGEGRIVCELTVAAPEGALLSWADALVVEAPDFALPLRSRVVGRLPEEGARQVVIALPLLATAENTGVLRVRARAVVCPEGREASCVTSSRGLVAPVAVKASPEGRAHPEAARSWPESSVPDRRGSHAIAWPPPGHDPR